MGSFGAHSVSPRGLQSHLLGKMVMVEGIVSKCKCSNGEIESAHGHEGSLVNPKVTKSVHYCPANSEVSCVPDLTNYRLTVYFIDCGSKLQRCD